MSRVLVVGLGGIGGTVAGHLLRHSVEVTALTTNAAIAEEICRSGFVLLEDKKEERIAGTAVTQLPPGAGPFDFILLGTQPPDAEAAAESALSFLAPGGALVCFQNGLMEERLTRLAGAERVIGAVVAWGASIAGPGRYERTSSGGFTLGRLDGNLDDPRLCTLATLLEPIGPVQVTGNLRGARWSKLALNCAISSLGTIGGDRLGALLIHRFMRRLGLEVMTEVVAVARQEGIKLEKVAGTLDLDWVVLNDQDKKQRGSFALAQKHALLLAVGARYHRLRSSMLAAIERGRRPAVGFLNGEVVDRATKHALPVPINRRIVELILAIARGEERPGLPLARRLYLETRS